MCQLLSLSELWRCGPGWQGGNLPSQPACLPHRELGRWNPRADIEGDFYNEVKDENNLELPVLTDKNDVKLEKEMEQDNKRYTEFSQTDASHIQAFKKSLA